MEDSHMSLVNSKEETLRNTIFALQNAMQKADHLVQELDERDGHKDDDDDDDDEHSKVSGVGDANKPSKHDAFDRDRDLASDGTEDKSELSERSDDWSNESEMETAATDVDAPNSGGGGTDDAGALDDDEELTASKETHTIVFDNRISSDDESNDDVDGVLEDDDRAAALKADEPALWDGSDSDKSVASATFDEFDTDVDLGDDAETRFEHEYDDVPALLARQIAERDGQPSADEVLFTGFDNQKCERQHNMVFLKVHKTGSDTLTIMLLRHAERHGLSPGLGGHYGGTQVSHSKQSIYSLRTPPHALARTRHEMGALDKISIHGVYGAGTNVDGSPHFNMLCFHQTLNRTDMDSVVPRATPFVAMLRRPLDQLRSHANYFGWWQTLREHLPEDLQRIGPLENGRRDKERERLRIDATLRYVLNDPQARLKGVTLPWLDPQSVDLGLKRNYTMADIEEFLERIKGELDFVMLMEHYDLSLVMLRRRMCWSHEDILYRVHNVALGFGKDTHGQLDANAFKAERDTLLRGDANAAKNDKAAAIAMESAEHDEGDGADRSEKSAEGDGDDSDYDAESNAIPSLESDAEEERSEAESKSAHGSSARRLLSVDSDVDATEVESLETLHARHVHADARLYAHYNRTFWSLVAAEGDDVFDELEHFRRLNAAVLEWCAHVASGAMHPMQMGVTDEAARLRSPNENAHGECGPIRRAGQCMRREECARLSDTTEVRAHRHDCAKVDDEKLSSGDTYETDSDSEFVCCVYTNSSRLPASVGNIDKAEAVAAPFIDEETGELHSGTDDLVQTYFQMSRRYGEWAFPYGVVKKSKWSPSFRIDTRTCRALSRTATKQTKHMHDRDRLAVNRLLHSHHTMLVGKQQVSCTHPYRTLILVMSHPDSAARRVAIRETWGSIAHRYDMKIMFVLGNDRANRYGWTGVDDVHDSVYGANHFKKEAHDTLWIRRGFRSASAGPQGPSWRHESALLEMQKYKDLIWVDVEESFEALPRKWAGALEWSANFCEESLEYIVKTDDDTYLTLSLLDELLSRQTVRKYEHLAMGQRVRYAVARQDTKAKSGFHNKYAVPHWNWPLERYYFDFVAGPLVVLSRSVVTRLIGLYAREPSFLLEPPTPNEDAYFGLALYRLKVPVTDLHDIPGTDQLLMSHSGSLHGKECEYRDTLLSAHPSTIQCTHYRWQRHSAIGTGALENVLTGQCLAWQEHPDEIPDMILTSRGGTPLGGASFPRSMVPRVYRPQAPRLQAMKHVLKGSTRIDERIRLRLIGTPCLTYGGIPFEPQEFLLSLDNRLQPLNVYHQYEHLDIDGSESSRDDVTSGLCATKKEGDSAGVEIRPCATGDAFSDDAASYQWERGQSTLYGPREGGEQFSLVLRSDNKCLSSDFEGTLKIEDCNKALQQQWQWRQWPSTYEMQSNMLENVRKTILIDRNTRTLVCAAPYGGKDGAIHLLDVIRHGKTDLELDHFESIEEMLRAFYSDEWTRILVHRDPYARLIALVQHGIMQRHGPSRGVSNVSEDDEGAKTYGPPLAMLGVNASVTVEKLREEEQAKREKQRVLVDTQLRIDSIKKQLVTSPALFARHFLENLMVAMHRISIQPTHLSNDVQPLAWQCGVDRLNYTHRIAYHQFRSSVRKILEAKGLHKELADTIKRGDEIHLEDEKDRFLSEVALRYIAYVYASDYIALDYDATVPEPHTNIAEHEASEKESEEKVKKEEREEKEEKEEKEETGERGEREERVERVEMEEAHQGKAKSDGGAEHHANVHKKKKVAHSHKKKME